MLISVIYSVLISISLVSSATVRMKIDVCRNGLLWAPKTYKYVYMTFLNDASCPSWSTRHIVSKATTGKDALVLPLGTPFAFACGACFPSSPIEVNLTLVSNGVEARLEPLRSAKGLLHSNGFTECLVSYGLTGPISKSGTLECQLNRGIKSTSEYLSFTTRKVDVEEEPEIIINANKNEAQLQCPEIPLKSKKNIVYVWHETLSEEPSLTPGFVVASLKRTLSIAPTSEVVRISCSVYDFIDPYKVWRTTYVVRSEKVIEDKIEKSEWSIDGGLKKPFTSQNNFLTLRNPVVWLIGGIVLVSVVGISLCIGYCGCTNRSKLPNLTPSHEGKNSLLSERRTDGFEHTYTNSIKQSELLSRSPQ